MNTFNNSFENQIKKQIEEREIAPSRDLWADIQGQKTDLPQKKSNLSWILAAACVVLTISLGYVLFFDSETDNIQNNQIVKSTPKVLDKENAEVVSEKNEQVFEVKNENHNLASEEKNPIHKQELIPSVKQEVRPEILNSQTAPKIIQNISKENLETQKMAKNDSVKVQIKKRKFVDPATLLFSVEHKDAIEKTKGGSNVATIDLNTK
ncbi:hypothetical protein [Chryseobacterium sp.]|uniref:hypothetical protein n=1 Tax=Chryseobacterium sp. TaxID=1871047 RepID=UPI002897B382|nr:hypothetical protein [Chryseobacterium sp.]